MKTKNICWGIGFVLLGMLWLLKSFEVIDFAWKNFLQLWPLIFVWIGIGLLPIKDWIKIVLNIITLLVGVGILFSVEKVSHSNDSFFSKESNIAESFPKIIPIDTQQVKKASLTIDLGATDFLIIKDTHLLTIHSNIDEHIQIEKEYKGSMAIIEVELNNHAAVFTRSAYCQFGLSPYPVWDMSFNMGVVSGDIDLSPFKVHKLELNTGVSDLSLTLGNLYPTTHVEISAGASNILISIPQNVTCYVKSESVITNHSFNDFEKRDKRTYINTPAVPSVGDIYIELNTGVSNIEIKRY